ncbi:hypothetical protein TNCV_2393321 [Trichonephila clavipes]|nr:hypothetical protein TNCV_2393321 [Trichonephila clavipes]
MDSSPLSWGVVGSSLTLRNSVWVSISQVGSSLTFSRPSVIGVMSEEKISQYVWDARVNGSNLRPSNGFSVLGIKESNLERGLENRMDEAKNFKPLSL